MLAIEIEFKLFSLKNISCDGCGVFYLLSSNFPVPLCMYRSPIFACIHFGEKRFHLRNYMQFFTLRPNDSSTSGTNFWLSRWNKDRKKDIFGKKTFRKSFKNLWAGKFWQTPVPLRLYDVIKSPFVNKRKTMFLFVTWLCGALKFSISSFDIFFPNKWRFFYYSDPSLNMSFKFGGRCNFLQETILGSSIIQSFTNYLNLFTFSN